MERREEGARAVRLWRSRGGRASDGSERSDSMQAEVVPHFASCLLFTIFLIAELVSDKAKRANRVSSQT